MKKLLSMAAACLLFSSASLPALANGYGLSGGIYDIVSDNRRYDGYVSTADDGSKKVSGRHVNHAILQNRYHAALIAAYRDGQVWQAETVSTTAVYQPGDERGEAPNTPELRHTDDGFILSYGDEQYTFVWDGQYILKDVFYDADSFYGDSITPLPENTGTGLLFFGAGPSNTFLSLGDALWNTDGITLSEFNIAQMPRSIAEVARMNRLRWALEPYAEPLAVGSTWQGVKNGARLPVYSAPDASSYRSAEGKAVVSLGGDVEILGTADGWTMIRYEVSPRTSRIGWIEGEYAGDMALQSLEFADIPLTAQVDTFLTDDPFVSQYAQVQLPAGTEMTGLALCGEFYAYVECTLNGTLYRGFVPMKDLDTTWDGALGRGTEYPMSAVRWDVMAALVGKWNPAEGANAQKMILFSDGFMRRSLRSSTVDTEEQNFRVYGEGKDNTYEVVFYREDNTEYGYTLTLCDDGSITLSDGEEVTEYTRLEYSTYGNG